MNGEALASSLIDGFSAHNYCFMGHRRKSYCVMEGSSPKLKKILYTFDEEEVTLEYPIVNTSSIFDAISAGENINLDFCYISTHDCKIISLILQSDKFYAINNFSARYAFFEGDINLSHVKFNGSVNFEGSQFGNGDVNFSRSHFYSNGVIFDYAQFGKGGVSFIGTTFDNGNKSFKCVNFSDATVDFTQTNFQSGDVDFSMSKFNTVVFTGAHFGLGAIDFSIVKFLGNHTAFTDVDFGDGVTKFGLAHFRNSTPTFDGVHFGKGTVDFSDAQFDQSASFYGANASNSTICFNKCNFIDRPNLRFKDVGTLEIKDCTIEKTLLMNSTDNNHVSIGKLSLQDTINLGQIFLDWDTAKGALYENGRQHKKSKSENDHTQKSYAQKARQFQMLKENYHNIGQYEDEDAAFVEYMRCKRKSEKLSVKRGLSCLIDVIGRYGTKPWNVAITIIFTWVVFGMLFALSISCFGGLESSGVALTCSQWWEGFYFSAITFLTIGYGDIAPATTLTKILAPIEGLLGLFLMSYFTVAVVRKTLR